MYRVILNIFKKQTKVKIEFIFGFGIPLFLIGFSHSIIYFTEDIRLFDVEREDYYL
jgi:hypothetical protein